MHRCSNKSCTSCRHFFEPQPAYKKPLIIRIAPEKPSKPNSNRGKTCKKCNPKPKTDDILSTLETVTNALPKIFGKDTLNIEVKYVDDKVVEVTCTVAELPIKAKLSVHDNKVQLESFEGIPNSSLSIDSKTSIPDNNDSQSLEQIKSVLSDCAICCGVESSKPSEPSEQAQQADQPELPKSHEQREPLEPEEKQPERKRSLKESLLSLFCKSASESKSQKNLENKANSLKLESASTGTQSKVQISSKVETFEVESESEITEKEIPPIIKINSNVKCGCILTDEEIEEERVSKEYWANPPPPPPKRRKSIQDTIKSACCSLLSLIIKPSTQSQNKDIKDKAIVKKETKAIKSEHKLESQSSEKLVEITTPDSTTAKLKVGLQNSVSSVKVLITSSADAITKLASRSVKAIKPLFCKASTSATRISKKSTPPPPLVHSKPTLWSTSMEILKQSAELLKTAMVTLKDTTVDTSRTVLTNIKQKTDDYMKARAEAQEAEHKKAESEKAEAERVEALKVAAELKSTFESTSCDFCDCPVENQEPWFDFETLKQHIVASKVVESIMRFVKPCRDASTNTDNNAMPPRKYIRPAPPTYLPSRDMRDPSGIVPFEKRRKPLSQKGINTHDCTSKQRTKSRISKQSSDFKQTKLPEDDQSTCMCLGEAETNDVNVNIQIEHDKSLEMKIEPPRKTKIDFEPIVKVNVKSATLLTKHRLPIPKSRVAATPVVKPDLQRNNNKKNGSTIVDELKRDLFSDNIDIIRRVGFVNHNHQAKGNLDNVNNYVKYDSQEKNTEYKTKNKLKPRPNYFETNSKTTKKKLETIELFVHKKPMRSSSSIELNLIQSQTEYIALENEFDKIATRMSNNEKKYIKHRYPHKCHYNYY